MQGCERSLCPFREEHRWRRRLCAVALIGAKKLIVAVYRFRFGWEDLGVTYSDIAGLMGRKPSTIPFRFANFLSYDGVVTGLNNGGRYAKEIYETYRNIPRDVLRRRVIQALLNLSRQSGKLQKETR